MRSKKRTVSAALFSCLLLSAPQTYAGKSDNTLNVAFLDGLTTLDAYKEPGRDGLILARLLYDGLLYKDIKTGEFKPALAESYEFADDKTLKLIIRKGVKFHDGSTLTPDDVVATLNRVASKEFGTRYQITVNWIDTVSSDGDVVTIKMKQPHPLALEMLADVLPIYPKNYVETKGHEVMAVAPIGTGPYKLSSITPGTSYRFERFADYYAESPKGTPAIPKINVKILPEANTQLAELLSGQVDWIWKINTDTARNLERRANVDVKATEIMRFAYLAFNISSSGDSPVKNLKVRQAVNMAIDRKAIVGAFVGASSQPIYGPCNPIQFGCSPNVVKYEYNPKKARELLAEAGYVNGFEVELIASLLSRQQMEAIVNNLAAVGVRAKLNLGQSSVTQTAWRNGEVPMRAGTWGSYGVADVGLSTSVMFSGTADDQIKDQQVMSWLNQADHTVDRTQREEIYFKAVERIAENAFFVPLWTNSQAYAQSKDLDFTLDVDEYARFYRATWK
jgi:peptide/nickel transport system substrate-binding protein